MNEDHKADKDWRYFKIACFLFPPLGMATLGLIAVGLIIGHYIELDESIDLSKKNVD